MSSSPPTSSFPATDSDSSAFVDDEIASPDRLASPAHPQGEGNDPYSLIFSQHGEYSSVSDYSDGLSDPAPPDLPQEEGNDHFSHNETSPESLYPDSLASPAQFPAQFEVEDYEPSLQIFSRHDDHDFLQFEYSDRSSEPLDRRSASFRSEINDQRYSNPASLSDSSEYLSDSSEYTSPPEESDIPSPLRGSSADQSPNDYNLDSGSDSYPFSPDLEDELELALLAELDGLSPLPDQRANQGGHPEDSMAASRQGSAAARQNLDPDVLVDLELYFRQERPQRAAQNQQGPADVIDLTNEPDSPVQNHAPRPSANPRRQNSQGRNPPSFARSDSSILAGNAPVIDLTDDSPEAQRPRRPGPPPPLPPPRHRDRGGPGSAFMLHNPGSAFSGLAAGIRRHLYPFRLFPPPDHEVQLLNVLQNRINQGDFNNPLGNIQLQYEHGAFDQRAESPKPVHQAPPPAKAGFTRDTGSDLVVICPACNEELAYNPDVPAAESHSTRKGKRNRSEHHFWALKACGHVYCEDCFENRKPVAKRPNTGFSRDPDSKIVCAVDGCETQATNKTSWVGIYL